MKWHCGNIVFTFTQYVPIGAVYCLGSKMKKSVFKYDSRNSDLYAKVKPMSILYCFSDSKIDDMLLTRP